MPAHPTTDAHTTIQLALLQGTPFPQLIAAHPALSPDRIKQYYGQLILCVKKRLADPEITAAALLANTKRRHTPIKVVHAVHAAPIESFLPLIVAYERLAPAKNKPGSGASLAFALDCLSSNSPLEAFRRHGALPVFRRQYKVLAKIVHYRLTHPKADAQALTAQFPRDHYHAPQIIDKIASLSPEALSRLDLRCRLETPTSPAPVEFQKRSEKFDAWFAALQMESSIDDALLREAETEVNSYIQDSIAAKSLMPVQRAHLVKNLCKEIGQWKQAHQPDAAWRVDQVGTRDEIRVVALTSWPAPLHDALASLVAEPDPRVIGDRLTAVVASHCQHWWSPTQRRDFLNKAIGLIRQFVKNHPTPLLWQVSLGDHDTLKVEIEVLAEPQVPGLAKIYEPGTLKHAIVDVMAVHPAALTFEGLKELLTPYELTWQGIDRKSTRLNSKPGKVSRMPPST